MKNLLKTLFMTIATIGGGSAQSQSTPPASWKPDMQVKMYSKGSSPGTDTVFIGTESFVESDRSGKMKKTKLHITGKDLDELLATFNRYDLTGIQSDMTLMSVKDGWSRYLGFTNGDKVFHLTTGSTFEIKDPVQKKNADAIYAYLNALLSRVKK